MIPVSWILCVLADFVCLEFDDRGFGWFLRAKKGGTCQTSLFSQKTTSRIMMNVGNPETAFAFGQLPNEGIGLARLEFAFW